MEERHSNLKVNVAFLKGLYGVDPFNTSGVDRLKYHEQGKVGVDVTSVITYKNPLMVNSQPMMVYLALRELVAFTSSFHGSY